MSKPAEDLTGQTYGRLTVRALDHVRDSHSHWVCECECGEECVVRSTKLKAGNTVSCGCWRADPAVRLAAALKTPARRRRQIAAMGAAARFAAK